MSTSKLRALNWYATLPVAGMLAFVGVMAAFFLYLHRTEADQQNQLLYRDVEWAQQSLILRWRANQDSVVANSPSWTQLSDAGNAVRPQLQELLRTNSDIQYIFWMDSRRSIKWLMPGLGSVAPQSRPIGQVIEDSAVFNAFTEARESSAPTYSPPFLGDANAPFVELHVPVFNDRAFIGTVAIGYNLLRSIQVTASEQMLARYKIDLADSGGNVLVSTSSRTIHDANLSYELPLNPPGHGIRLRAFAFETRPLLLDRILVTSVFGLSSVVLVGLGLLWYFARQRIRAESRLVEETHFRRAMEDSISTGMRVMDLEGKITYVNPAFCNMLGFAEKELVGLDAPYPYWPIEQQQMHQDNLSSLLMGKIPPAGLRTEVQRKDGTRFFARMYVSPLKNKQGAQTGWMTSMTDITEPERIREQLRAAHEQFTTVMEQLDAAVCVLEGFESLPSNRLLFTNQRYRNFFGDQLQHSIVDLLKDEQRGPEVDIAFEHFSQSTQSNQWFELRWRPIRWVDQSEAILVLVSDITLRHGAQALLREQQERVERTSRLISMGEMASSLAHELNQPLTAISNYTMGGAARLQQALDRNEPVPTKDLSLMLEKTARQAERAGKVVRRIRDFVKRSEPDKQACNAQTIVEDALGLAELDAKRMQMQIQVKLQDDLPTLMADPILIEQVLLNLMKNGMESMLNGQNRILEVSAKATDQTIEICVADRGSGVSTSDRDKLFEPFFTTKADGMGMGLNICRTIVEFHQGRLTLNDRVGGGTEFVISLPINTKLVVPFDALIKPLVSSNSAHQLTNQTSIEQSEIFAK
jgi:PAS domain S-box-containing protein